MIQRTVLLLFAALVLVTLSTHSPTLANAGFLDFLKGKILPAAAQEPVHAETPYEVKPKREGKRVAVIGAGAAGASSAYFLRQYLSSSEFAHSEPVEIVAFEKADYIGGRSTTVNAWDDPAVPIELGASIFVEVNQNLINASRELGLTVSSSGAKARLADDDDASPLGIYDGDSFVFKFTNGKWSTLAKLFYRYGPMTPWKTKKLTEATVSKFLSLYREPHFPFSSLSQAVEDVGLLGATGTTGEQFLKANGIEGRFPEELIQSSTRVNYGQNLGLIHGLETMVCLAAEGAMSVEGGNWQIFDGMLKASNTTVHLRSTVSSLRKNGAEWELSWKVDGFRHVSTEVFDSVIIAAPFQQTGLSIDPAPEKTPDEIPYVTLHVTLFSSPLRLDPTRFGLKPEEKTPAVILTTLNEEERANSTVRQGTGTVAAGNTGFFSISTLRTVERPDGRQYVYKVFSPEPFSDDKIRGLVGATEDNAITWTYRKEWLSYPYEYPRVTFEDLRLGEDLWYTGGMESFISTMETNSLMGRNIAKLIVDEWDAVKREAVERQRQLEELEKEGKQEELRSLEEEMIAKDELNAEPQSAPAEASPAAAGEKVAEKVPEPEEESMAVVEETKEVKGDGGFMATTSDETKGEEKEKETTAADPSAIDPETEAQKAEL